MKDFTRKIIIPACVCFTVITFIYAAVNYAIYGGGADAGLISSGRTLLFFVFSLIFSTANALLRSDKPALSLRVVLHAVICGFGFWLCLIMPADIKGSTALMGMLIFFVIYAIIAAILLLNRAAARRKENSEEDYKPMISDKDKK